MQCGPQALKFFVFVTKYLAKGENPDQASGQNGNDLDVLTL
jgi:hypothetical protein